MKSVKVYVGEDKKLHFVDSSGADTVIPFSSVPSSESAPDSLSLNWSIGGNTGWVERAQTSSGTWNHNTTSDRFYVYKNLGLYKLVSISISCQAGAETQDGGSASSSGTIYLDKVNIDAGTATNFWTKSIRNGNTYNAETYVLQDSDFESFDGFKLRSSINYNASAGWGTYSQATANYSFGVVGNYEKV